MMSESIDGLESRLEVFRESDKQRDTLINELLRRYRELQVKTEAQEKELGSLNNSISKHAYVFALIDGDGAPFVNGLLQHSSSGGTLAAYLLQNEIKNYIRTSLPGISGDVKIRAQIFLNVDGLRRKLFASRQIPKDYDYSDFVRQFNMHSHSFNMVDVGWGKEHADHKLRDAFTDQLGDPLCKHIILGVCHDKGYLPILRQYQYDKDCASRVTLLFTNSTQEEFRQMDEFRNVRFSAVFREEPLPEKPASPKMPAVVPKAPPVTSESTAGHDRSNGLASPASVPATSNSPAPPVAAKPKPIPETKQPSMASSPVLTSPPAALEAKWTAVATKGKTQTVIDIAPTPAPSESAKKYVVLNEAYQRLDSPILKSAADWETYTTLRKRHGRNFCNNYTLGGGCHDDNCQYLHEPHIPPGVKLALQYMVRRIACLRGLSCMEAICYLGHNCAYGATCANSDCKFSDEQHYLDTTPYYRMDAAGTIKRI